MTKQDPPGGLFSRVVKFVSNPTTPWRELDQPEPSEEKLTKEALKDMILRKRRNDAIRQREFDQLRRLRNKGLRPSDRDATSPPSFFQSSLPSKLDERATTLKKIDEIEAQMSRQWWSAQDEARMNAASVATTHLGQTDEAEPPSLASDMVAEAPEEQTVSAPLALTPSNSLQELDLTDAMPSLLDAPSAPTDVMPLPAKGLDEVAGGGFPGDRLFAVEVAERVHDPELEEAAIRFANGDDRGAEMALLEAVAPNGPRHGHLATWLVLLDLYRATGQQALFEGAAIDVAHQFGRSAPMWVSLPAELARAVASLPDEQPTPSTARGVDWAAPHTLGRDDLGALAAAVQPQGPSRVDWSALRVIEVDAANELLTLWARWCNQPLQLEFVQGGQLLAVLLQATPANQPRVDPVWWKLRMEACRLMHKPDHFEAAALDYCVTYEVSPPAWAPGLGEYLSVDATGAQTSRSMPLAPESTLIGDSGLWHPSTLVLDSTHAALVGEKSVAVALAGHLVGDAELPLAQLDARWGDSPRLAVDCGRLIRVDFAAAGAVLNWAAAHRAEGRVLCFFDVHRVLAPLFSVVGLDEQAQVLARSD